MKVKYEKTTVNGMAGVIVPPEVADRNLIGGNFYYDGEIYAIVGKHSLRKATDGQYHLSPWVLILRGLEV